MHTHNEGEWYSDDCRGPEVFGVSFSVRRGPVVATGEMSSSSY